MLDTEYYNDRIASLHIRSEFNGVVASFLNAINDLDAIIVACSAAQSDFPISAQEALGDYVKKGAGSVTTMVARVYKAIFDMGVWVIDTIKKMLIYAIKGFPGTVGGAIRTAEKIGARVADMQKVKVKTGLSPKLAERVEAIMTAHATHIDVTLTNGKISDAKKEYLDDFNSKMKSDDAKINASFMCVNAPNHLGNITLGECDVTNSDELKSIGEHFQASETTLKDRLNELKKEGDIVRSVIKTIKAKGFKDDSVNNAESVQVLAAAYHAAVLANDMKYLHLIESCYISMVHSLKKAAKEYVA